MHGNFKKIIKGTNEIVHAENTSKFLTFFEV